MKSSLIFSFLVIYSLFSSAQQTINGSIFHDNLQREYIMYIPPTYSSADPAPLVLCFHGFTSNSNLIFNYTNFKSIADTAGFIFVCPQGTLFQGLPHWNIGIFGSTVDDLGFTNTLIDHITSTYSINEERIYSTGMSNGGYMSFLLACELSNRFAAVASVTGSMTNMMMNDCNPQHPTPILQIHGTSDGTVPYYGNATYSKPIEDVLEYWSAHNNCNMNPSIATLPDINPFDGSTAEHFIYSGCDNLNTVEHFKIIGGGHDWPGVFGNMDINASIEIWKFFSKYDINGAIVGSSSIESIQRTFEVYPIPSSSFISIDSDFSVGTIYKIFSIHGKLIHQDKINSSSEHLDISNFSPGSYSIKINGFIKKFIVTK